MKNKNLYFNFKNKKVIVLGSSGGIGKMIVEDFLEAGAEVIGISRSKVKLNNKKFTQLNFDITKINQNELRNLLKRFKNIDCLINSFAISIKSNDNIQPYSDFEKTINNNIISYFKIVIEIVKKMKTNSSIVHITSINSKFAFENNPGYQASKSALSALTRSFAKDLSNKKIRVNSIAPSYIKTKMTEKSYKNKEKRSYIAKKSLLKRWGDPKEISSVALFLCSSGSSFINGQEILVDGGWSIDGGV